MNSNQFSRRIFLKGLLVSLALAGCGPRNRAAGEGGALFSPSPTPFPSPTPPPPPEMVLQTYLDAWTQNDFQTMYTMLSPESRTRIAYQAFLDSYRNALNQTTAPAVTVQVQSLLVEEVNAIGAFHSNWPTVLFGPLEADHTIRLRFDQGQWWVVWDPTLIMPQLEHGVSLVLLEEQPQRGLIYDSIDHALALQDQVVTIGVVPGLVQDEGLVLNQLSPITGLTPDQIRTKMAAARPTWFVPLADVSFETNVRYHDLLSGLGGVQRQTRSIRTYADGNMAAHTIGMLGAIPAEQLDSYRRQGYRGDELVGLTGIEGWGEIFLAGRRGGRLVTMSKTREELAELASAPVKPSGNIYLSLDTELQKRAEAILGEQEGALVVMDVDGYVRVLASQPRFSPKDFANGIDIETWTSLINDQRRPLINRTTLGVYPPASVFKIVSMAAAMEYLGYQPDHHFFCAGTWDVLGDDFIKKCWLETGHGDIDLLDGLTRSCDVVFYEVGLALHRNNPAWLPEMARAFGLGQETGIMGLDELPGVVPDSAWKQQFRNRPFFDGDAVNMAIGQGDILVTPLQIARMLAAVANGGTLYRPQLVRRLSSRDRGDQFFQPEVVGSLPVSAETLKTIQIGLFNVVHSERGTARRAFSGFGYTAAGKTGTAESGQEAPHAWFAGYAPAENPEIAIAVIVEHAGEGSDVAAPLFRRIVEEYFALQGL